MSSKSFNNIYSNYLFFWGEKKSHGYLSNFYPCEFVVEGLKYNCSEQYFMKKKQELFDNSNKNLGEQIMAEINPKQIKNYGRVVKNFDQTIWDKNKYQIMYQGVKSKFISNPELAKKLLDTKNKKLVEASPYDKIWGIGLSESDAKKISNPTNWPGTNLLGQILEQVRDELSQTKY
jgi:ribA/ribD-fused uncharacterized protein